MLYGMTILLISKALSPRLFLNVASFISLNVAEGQLIAEDPSFRQACSDDLKRRFPLSLLPPNEMDLDGNFFRTEKKKQKT